MAHGTPFNFMEYGHAPGQKVVLDPADHQCFVYQMLDAVPQSSSGDVDLGYSLPRLKRYALEAEGKRKWGLSAHFYTAAIHLACMSPMMPQHAIAELFSCRSLMYNNLRMHDEAIMDAGHCMNISQCWFMGYSRASQATLDPIASLEFLFQGMIACSNDMPGIAYLITEVVMKVDQHATLGLPDLLKSWTFPNYETKIWTRVLENLVVDKKWRAVRMIYCQSRTTSNFFCSIASKASVKNINITDLWSSSRNTDLADWGIKTAIAMLQNGAKWLPGKEKWVTLEAIKISLNAGFTLQGDVGEEVALESSTSPCIDLKAKSMSPGSNLVAFEYTDR